MRKAAILLAAAVVGLALASSASTMSTKKLQGTVGPGFTITLKKGGKKVTSLKAGKYSIAVADKSNIHDFHLKGPGVNKVITSVSFTGNKTVTLTLKKGKYTFVCDPHASSMHGSFKVT
jgi:plastocyanin